MLYIFDKKPSSRNCVSKQEESNARQTVSNIAGSKTEREKIDYVSKASN
jgi:hypothetical protein